MIQNNRKIITIAIITFFVILLVVDRYYWAQISQWREDQATNIWLGYTSGVRNIPVGLISSTDIPNPNGMVLLGFILSALPNLLSVSFFLGLIQIVLLTLVGWRSFGRDWKYFLLAVIPSLLSVILRSSSVEFWNQYTMTLVNICFIYLAVRYLEKPSLWSLPPIIVLILLAPSLYLAGIVNAIVMAFLTSIILLYRRPRLNGAFPVLIILLILISSSIILTWHPYFQNVGLEQILGYRKGSLGMVGTLHTFWNAFWSLPNYVTFQWTNSSEFDLTFKHASPQLLSSTSNFLLKLVGRTYLLQAVFAFTVFASLLVAIVWKLTSSKNFEIRVNSPALRLVILAGLFISLSYGISSWLNGPAWIEGERPDQTVQFLPMFLFIIFLLPTAILIGGCAGKIISGISYISLAGFSIINILCGFLIIRDHLQYRGDVLTEADVPLIQKMQALDFIVTDWKKRSNSNIIPVDYDIGGGKWDWVPEFGNKLLQWYPAPMTQGRSFDYELLRHYDLINWQEGKQIRAFGNARYLVTYAFEAPPQSNRTGIRHYIFGRLRVSVLEE
ncbi:MAG: hypothetical protein L6Q26_05195 [Anaerolineales bacterium]|nr:hypothetical protein [Anaerolineales bacterium]NUQ84250.1 hypothetical protein [Anaerolineales bacterium]